MNLWKHKFINFSLSTPLSCIAWASKRFSLLCALKISNKINYYYKYINIVNRHFYHSSSFLFPQMINRVFPPKRRYQTMHSVHKWYPIQTYNYTGQMIQHIHCMQHLKWIARSKIYQRQLKDILDESVNFKNGSNK